MTRLQNPILPGFHPDPSLCRVGEDYYIAVSTFEWFPGVQIFHSRDLANWKLIARPLDRKSQLDMIGVPDSGGVWAPCLSHCDGLFYLIYSNVKHWKGTYIDCPNYLVTAPSIEGPWTDPVYLNSSGIDPSLFHDADGKKWLLNQKWDYRSDNHNFDGIVMQEYDAGQKKLVGPIRKIFSGSERRVTEGPHLYKRKDWYYLMTAEGGTSYEHTVTLARSKNIEGPYELHPNTYLVTAHEKEGSLKKAGHGSWAPIDEDTYALVHLCSRLFNDEERCILGRETALQLIRWDEDDWPYLLDENGEITRDNAPRETVSLPGDVNSIRPSFQTGMILRGRNCGPTSRAYASRWIPPGAPSQRAAWS
jgi:xylan 1,4-beta-xylosidase